MKLKGRILNSEQVVILITKANCIIIRKEMLLVGRAYEFAARVSTFFKEKEGKWSGDSIEEPAGCYLIVSELAKRTAEGNKQWVVSEKFKQINPKGYYSPRVKIGTYFPFSLTILEGK